MRCVVMTKAHFAETGQMLTLTAKIAHISRRRQMRLIDADKPKETIGEMEFRPVFLLILQIIDEQPTGSLKRR